MTYEQLERCYNTVMKQRDEAEVKVTELTIKCEDLETVIDKFAVKTQQMLNDIKAI